MGFVFLWQTAGSASSVVKAQWFEDYVRDLDPLCWWRLNEASGAAAIRDYGRLGQHGTADGSIPTTVLEGAVQGPDTERARWFNNYNGQIKCGGAPWFDTVSGEIREELTVAFWALQGADYNNISADVMGFMGGPEGGYGWRISIDNNAVTFSKHSHLGVTSIVVPASYMPNYADFDNINQGDYALYTFVISKAGVLRAYVNAQEVAAATNTGTPGWRTPPTAFGYSGEFRIGPMGYANPPQNLALDEIIIFEQALKRNEIASLFVLGQYGKSYSGTQNTVVGGFTGYPLSEYENPTFVSSEDITDDVVALSLQADVSQLIDTGSMVLASGIESTPLTLIPNDYILVEQKESNGLEEDEDWTPIAHFLVEGEPARAQGAEGSDKAEVSLKGPLKLLQLDSPLNEIIEADRIPIRLEPLVRLGTAPDGAWELQVERPGVRGSYLDKWVPSPSPTIYVSKFRNKTKEPGKDEEYNDTDMPPKILVKGAQNAVQVLPGLGMVRVDPDFYEAPIGYGLGDPDPDGGLNVKGERYADYADVLNAQVTGVYARKGRWMLSLAGVQPVYSSIGDVEVDVTAAPGAQVVYSDDAAPGDWGNAGVSDVEAYNGVYYRTAVTDQTVTYTSPEKTDRLSIRSMRFSGGGIMEVQVDGSSSFLSRTLPTVAELKAADSTEYGHLTLDDNMRVISLYSLAKDGDSEIQVAEGLTPGVHTLVLRCTGEKQASALNDEVNVSAFMCGEGDPEPKARDLGSTVLVDTGSAAGKRFKIVPLSDLAINPVPFGRPAHPTSGVQADDLADLSAFGGTGTWTGGLDATSPTSVAIQQLDLGSGAPSAAAGLANTEAAYTEFLEYDEKSIPLKLGSLQMDSAWSEEEGMQKVGRIVLKVRRLAYRGWVNNSGDDLGPPTNNMFTGTMRPAALYTAGGFASIDVGFSKWGANGFITDSWVGLTIDGQPLSTNKAQGATLKLPTFSGSAVGLDGRATDMGDYSKGITSWNTTTPQWEEASYSFTPEEWGLAGGVTLADASRIGAVLQAKSTTSGETNQPVASKRTAKSVAIVESVRVIFEPFNSTGPTTEFALFNEQGAVCNPVEEGLAAGDSVRVGDCGAVEDVLAHHLRKCGFQSADSTAPLYFEIQGLPSALQAIVMPQRYVVDNPTGREQAVQSTIQNALPNYFLHTAEDGVTRLEPFIQKTTADVDVSGWVDVATNTSDYGVYTAVLVQGDGGYSINAAAGYRSAIRSAKLNNWATGESTPSGTGENSKDGIAYESSDAHYAIMNARLRQILDTSNSTPYLDTGGWTKAQSYGVLWSAKGTKINQFSMEDEPLFVLDIGRADTGLQHRIAQFQVGHINTYPWADGMAQALQFFYMTEEDYMSIYGTLPPDSPDQDNADLADSYMPSPFSALWKPLTDRVSLSPGLNFINSDQFINQQETQARFILVRCLQAHYFSATNTEDRRARISITEFGVYTSTMVRSTAVLGASGTLSGDGHREIMSRLRMRTYVVDENPYISSYELGQEHAAIVLDEMTRDFAPKAITTYQAVQKGQTISYVDGRGVARTALVLAVNSDLLTGRRTLKATDYNASQSLSGVYS